MELPPGKWWFPIEKRRLFCNFEVIPHVTSATAWSTCNLQGCIVTNCLWLKEWFSGRRRVGRHRRYVVWESHYDGGRMMKQIPTLKSWFPLETCWFYNKMSSCWLTFRPSTKFGTVWCTWSEKSWFSYWEMMISHGKTMVSYWEMMISHGETMISYWTMTISHWKSWCFNCMSRSELETMRSDHRRILNPTPYKVSVTNELHLHLHG